MNFFFAIGVYLVNGVEAEARASPHATVWPVCAFRITTKDFLEREKWQPAGLTGRAI
jgi:hypothetical protein